MSLQKACDALSARVASILRQERLSQHMSLNDLAAKSGVSRQMISYVEREKRNPSLDTLLRITFALDVHLDEVLRKARRLVSEHKSG